MIFCTAMSQLIRVACIRRTRKWKASHLNTITPLLPERIHSRLSLLGIQKHHLQLKVWKSTVRHMWRLERDWNNKTIFWGGKKWCFFNIITPNPTVWSHFSGDTQHRILRCFTPLMQPKFGTVWLLVVCSYQETSQRNSFHIWWRRSSCYRKKCFENSQKRSTDRFEKLLQSWWYYIKQVGDYMEKCGTEMRYTFWPIFCVLFNFDTLSRSEI